MLAVVVAEGVAVALLAVLVLGLLRSHALILRALHELGAGLELEEAASARDRRHDPARCRSQLEPGVVPATRPATTGRRGVVGTHPGRRAGAGGGHGEGRRTLLAFLSSGCSVCRTFWAELSSGAVDVPGRARLVVVTQGPEEESVSRLRQLAGPRLEVVRSSGAWTDYGVPGSPYFVYVEDGRVTGEGSSTTWAQVRDLMGQAVDDTAAARRAGARDAEACRRGTARPGRRDDLPRSTVSCSAPGSTRGTPACTSRRSRPEPAGAAGRPRADAHRSMNPATVALALGLPMAAVAAVRSTWSP